MDHAIDYLRESMYMDTDLFLEEWRTGQFTSIKECPSYEYVKAYCDAINALTKVYYGKEASKYTITPIKLIRIYEEYEQ